MRCSLKNRNVRQEQGNVSSELANFECPGDNITYNFFK